MAPKSHISNPADSKSEVAASYIFSLNILFNLEFHINNNIYNGKLWKSMGSINCFVTQILQNIFCVQQKKEIHGLDGTTWGWVNFWVNYTFKKEKLVAKGNSHLFWFLLNRNSIFHFPIKLIPKWSRIYIYIYIYIYILYIYIYIIYIYLHCIATNHIKPVKCATKSIHVCCTLLYPIFAAFVHSSLYVTLVILTLLCYDVTFSLGFPNQNSVTTVTSVPEGKPIWNILAEQMREDVAIVLASRVYGQASSSSFFFFGGGGGGGGGEAALAHIWATSCTKRECFYIACSIA